MYDFSSSTIRNKDIENVPDVWKKMRILIALPPKGLPVFR